jgi:hypothetical protein
MRLDFIEGSSSNADPMSLLSLIRLLDKPVWHGRMNLCHFMAVIWTTQKRQQTVVTANIRFERSTIYHRRVHLMLFCRSEMSFTRHSTWNSTTVGETYFSSWHSLVPRFACSTDPLILTLSLCSVQCHHHHRSVKLARCTWSDLTSVLQLHPVSYDSLNARHVPRSHDWRVDVPKRAPERPRARLTA